MNQRKYSDVEQAERKRQSDILWRKMGGDCWSQMKARCYNPNNKKFHLYGGRGIKVCARWRNSFANCLADMGIRPGSRYSIDRYPDKDGDYEPNNCRWATGVEQNRNRNFNRVLTHGGRTQCVAAWAKEIGVSHSTISERLKRGWTVAEALQQ